MKQFFLLHRHWWLALAVLLVGIKSGRAQNWIQWKSTNGGNDHYYALTPTATNWSAAEKFAVSWGGTLATITSAEEQEFINTTFLNGSFAHLPVWIGLFDEPTKAPFSGSLGPIHVQIGNPKNVNMHWVTDEPLSYSNWKPGEPSRMPGEYYVAINWEYSDNPPRGVKGDWNDTPLDGTKGYGGTTSGPYFGLVERVTDPRLPVRSGAVKLAAGAGLVVLLAMILVIYFARKKRRGKMSLPQE